MLLPRVQSLHLVGFFTLSPSKESWINLSICTNGIQLTEKTIFFFFFQRLTFFDNHEPVMAMVKTSLHFLSSKVISKSCSRDHSIFIITKASARKLQHFEWKLELYFISCWRHSILDQHFATFYQHWRFHLDNIWNIFHLDNLTTFWNWLLVHR